MIIAGHTGIQNTKSLFPLHRYQRSVQLQFYISRAERHITNNYFSRPLKSPWPIQNWEVGVSPIWFYGVPVLSRPPTLELLLLKVATDATSSPQPHRQRTPPLQPNARATEENRGKELSSILRRKKAREGGERRGKCLNLGIYLLKQKKTHIQLHAGRNPSSQSWGALLLASVCLELHSSFLPLSHTHRSILKSSLNCQAKAYLRFNESLIHYNKSQHNINICRKNRLSTAPQQMLVLIQ